MKNISVVIVSYNTKALLIEAIKSLLPQLDPTRDELIVVDNSSPDGSADQVRKDFPSVRLLALDKDYGYSYGANRGFEVATGEYLVITSSDIVFKPGSIDGLVSRMKARDEIGVVCPELVDFSGILKQLTWQWGVWLGGELMNKLFSPTSIARRKFIRSLLPLLQRKEMTVSWVSGAVFLIRRTAMEKIHGFDEKFQLYYEDTDLFVRVRSAGYKILFSPQVKVFHGLGESTKNEKSKSYLMFIQSRLYYYQKHLPGFQYHLLRAFLKLKFSRSADYKKGGAFRQWVDHILNQKGTIPLWQDIQI